MVKICIIHYNTPLLTECLIRSINKYTPNSLIYIFDNSDEKPFTYRQENIIYLDNTKHELLNFDDYFKKFPKSKDSRAKKGGWASFKHACSIQKCIEIIDDNFILLDSDVILTRDISSIVKENCMYVGGYMKANIKYNERVYPFLLFLNVKMMKEKGISFFDENRIFGLNHSEISEKYDTGASFYQDTKKYNKSLINILLYIKHYAAGSYYNVVGYKKISPEQWLEQNKKHWKTNMKNKKVIYTCITGKYDYLISQPKIEGYDYVAFTNNYSSSSTWEIRQIPEHIKNLSEVKQQRYIKLHPHELLKEYDYSIWIDANVKVISDPSSLFDDKYSVEIPKHPARDCIYEEKKACLLIKKDTNEIMEPQMQRYRAEKYPTHNGLVQSNIMLRRHNEEDCIKLMETWWSEIEKGSHRDQLSFNYALWKNTETRFKYLHEKTCDSVWFKWYKFHGEKLARHVTVEKDAPTSPQPIKEEAPKKYKWLKKLNKDEDQENNIVKTFLSMR